MLKRYSSSSSNSLPSKSLPKSDSSKLNSSPSSSSANFNDSILFNKSSRLCGTNVRFFAVSPFSVAPTTKLNESQLVFNRMICDEYYEKQTNGKQNIYLLFSRSILLLRFRHRCLDPSSYTVRMYVAYVRAVI